MSSGNGLANLRAVIGEDAMRRAYVQTNISSIISREAKTKKTRVLSVSDEFAKSVDRMYCYESKPVMTMRDWMNYGADEPCDGWIHVRQLHISRRRASEQLCAIVDAESESVLERDERGEEYRLYGNPGIEVMAQAYFAGLSNVVDNVFCLALTHNGMKPDIRELRSRAVAALVHNGNPRLAAHLDKAFWEHPTAKQFNRLRNSLAHQTAPFTVNNAETGCVVKIFADAMSRAEYLDSVAKNMKDKNIAVRKEMVLSQTDMFEFLMNYYKHVLSNAVGTINMIRNP